MNPVRPNNIKGHDTDKTVRSNGVNKTPLSIVVITKNEETNIERCLKSADWADEIVILDSGSTDNTLNIADRYTDKIHKRDMDIEGTHRNYAYSLASNDWILSLDADEEISPQLQKEITNLLKDETAAEKDVYSIPIKTFIGDRWAQYAGWYPAPKVRLFKKGRFRYDDAEVHPRIYYEGNCGHLKSDILHYAYKDLSDLFDNLNEQSALQAKEWFREKRKFSALRFVRTSYDRFLKKYFLKGGFKGGVLGFVLSASDGIYQFMSYAKLWELYKKNER